MKLVLTIEVANEAAADHLLGWPVGQLEFWAQTEIKSEIVR